MRRSSRSVKAVVLGAISVIAAAASLTPQPVRALTSVPHDEWNTRRILDIAHAGGDYEAPHSTLFAMKQAVSHGADVLEMDVRLSSDGVLMVHHDDTIDRTTDGTGAFNSYTAAQLQAFDNAYWFYPNCWSCHSQPSSDYLYRGMRTGAVAPPAGFSPDDFAIQTFATVAATFPDRILDVEIKAGPDAYATADALAAFIATHGPSDRYLVVSFDDAVTAYFKTLAPNVATSPGQGEMIDWFVNRGPMPAHRVVQVPPTFSGIDVVTQQFVDDAHAQGLAVWVWFNGTEDDQPTEWQRLIGLGVDGLLTASPSQAADLLDHNATAFRIAPDTSATRHDERSIDVTLTCPVAHVDSCAVLTAFVAKNALGRWELVAVDRAAAARATTGVSRAALTRFGRRLLRLGPADVTAVQWPLNHDTAPALATLTIQ